LLEGETGVGEVEHSAAWMQNMHRDAVFQKKQAKVRKYEINSGGKKYKKYLLTKRFREDEESNARKMK